MDEDADSVCEDSMNTAQGRDEEDACNSVFGQGPRRRCTYIPGQQGRHRDNQNVDGFARGGSKNTHTDTDSISESDFCITVAQNEEKPVAGKLAKVTARSRFSVKLSENKLKEKPDFRKLYRD